MELQTETGKSGSMSRTVLVPASPKDGLLDFTSETSSPGLPKDGLMADFTSETSIPRLPKNGLLDFTSETSIPGWQGLDLSALLKLLNGRTEAILELTLL